MSELAGTAVFLSYASQDVEAAKRICEALRAAGVEVWFDQSELVGGDQWDQKIRGQVKSCALFVPVISAATQARTEGYFRLEWRLADQRTHLMAKGRPFLLPVVIDETRDSEAHVPDSFLDVQWTRLPGGETPEKFCARVKALLGGSAVDVGPVADRAPGQRPGLQQTRKPSRPWLIPTIIGVIACTALALWQPWKKSPSAPSQSAAPAPAATAPKSVAETAADFAAQARNRYYPFATPANLQLADESSRRATELDPQYARGWGTRANASARYLLRSFVSGEAAQARARDAQTFANRALTLDKNETEALVALGIVAMHQHAPMQAETLFRRVLAADPNNVQAPSLLSMVLRDTGRGAEALPLMKRAVANAPRDPILHLFLGFAYWSGWNFPKAAEQFDIAATVADFQAARVYQAWVVFLQTGDLARLRTMLESVDLIYSAEDAKLTYLLACGLFERRADRVIEAAGRTASAYFDGVAMPKAWFSALAYESDRKDNLARQQWLAAEAVIRERLRADPQSELLRVNLAITLVKLGRTPDARTEFDAVEAVWREQLTAGHALWLARFHAAVGDAPRAVALLRQCVNRLGDNPESFQNTTSRTIQFDPWWDPIRDTPEFRELLAHPPEPPAPIDDEPAQKTSSSETKTDGKSIAVLAFDNRSDDKSNDSFSDGMSEELLNVLSKVPGLTVKARNSSFYFKGRNATPQEIGQQLGVAHFVSGSVEKLGNSVRIFTQLSRTDTGDQIWTERFNGELDKPWALQERIAGRIAEELKLKLGVSARAAKTVNPEVHRLVLEGRHFWYLRTEEGFTRADAAFAEALKLDPQFAPAHAGLADVCLIRDFFRRMDGLPRIAGDSARAHAEAQRALDLDGSLVEPHATLGFYWLNEGRFAEAEREFQRAFAANPNYAPAHHWRAALLNCQGRLDLASQEYQRTVELDPLWFINVSLYAEHLAFLQRYEEALATTERAAALRPETFIPLQGDRAYILLQLGRTSAAAGVARAMGDSASATLRWYADADAIWVLRRAGAPAEADNYAQRVLKQVAPDSYLRGFVLAALDRFPEALPWLAQTPPWAVRKIYWDRLWDPVRDDPRFQQLMVKLGCAEEYKVARETLERMLKEQAAKK